MYVYMFIYVIENAKVTKRLMQAYIVVVILKTLEYQN